MERRGNTKKKKKKKRQAKPHCHKNTHSDMQSDTPLRHKDQQGDWASSAVQPPKAESQLCECVQPSGLGGRGEKFPQRQAWLSERDDAFLL